MVYFTAVTHMPPELLNEGIASKVHLPICLHVFQTILPVSVRSIQEKYPNPLIALQLCPGSELYPYSVKFLPILLIVAFRGLPCTKG